ncbi:MAG: DNA translocase FtsK 4TM domain-containing protein [Pseudomonadota bacterium]
MAYQTRQRDPLLDRDMQAALERRARELIGLALLAVGSLLALILWSYSPDDPSWLAATDAPVSNFLGYFGASIASPVFVISGFGAWAVVVIAVVWGLRFITGRGTERAIARLIFAPIAVALASVFVSTYVPPAGWSHSFGLGGLFGDTVLGAVLGVVPVTATLGLKMLSFVLLCAVAAIGLFVLGCTRDELWRFGRFMIRGVLLAYDRLLWLLGATAALLFKGAAAAGRMATTRRPRALEKDGIVAHPMTPPEGEALAAEQSLRRPAAGGLLSRALGRTPLPEPGGEPGSPIDPDLSAKISDAVRARRADGSGLGLRGPTPIMLRATDRVDDELEMRDLPESELVPPAPIVVPVEPAPTFESARAERPRVVQPAAKPPKPSARAEAEAQPSLFDDRFADYELPALGLLAPAVQDTGRQLSDEALEENARMLEAVLDDYGVKGEIVSVRPGPVVTMYELEPAPGLKASRVIGLADDIARSMSALSARVSTVPGRSVIGIELPNAHREKVMLREQLASRDYGDGTQSLPLALGKDIGGAPVVANLAKMPHLLIAGTTGSGKSVAINTMILSLLYKLTPEQCRLIMIDPKMLELSVYDGIPHLLSPVVTDPKKAVVALKWVVGEMEERYRKMSKMGVRNIEGYNGRVADALSKGETFSRTVQTGFDDDTGEPIFETEEITPEAIPYIVVIVDEMADLMMVAGKEIEACIQRLAQMARASGIHLIMATQRPSVDVITGTIKANFPTRISFQVTSKVDSRTILGEQGAEQLLGMGDMLYMAGGAKITRVHGPFVSDEEVEEIVSHLKGFGPPDYISGVVEGPEEEKTSNIDAVLGLGGNTDGEDALYDQAVAIVIKDRKCSTSYIQRKLGIGYNKAARLVERMEDEGVVSSANHVGKREILVPEQG